jgi:hypothetical protein
MERSREKSDYRLLPIYTSIWAGADVVTRLRRFRYLQPRRGKRFLGKIKIRFLRESRGRTQTYLLSTAIRIVAFISDVE